MALKASDKGLATLGATNLTNKKREDLDFYSTPEIATKELMKIIDFNNTTVLEPSCGTLAISKVIEKYTNANIINKDIVARIDGIQEEDFLLSDNDEKYDIIVTNPPFKYCQEFVLKALGKATKKVAMLMKIQFLEGQKRYDKIHKVTPPTEVHIFTYRLPYLRGDSVQETSSAMCLCWFIWDKETMEKEYDTKVKFIGK